jgi:hypothetical protein
MNGLGTTDRKIEFAIDSLILSTEKSKVIPLDMISKLSLSGKIEWYRLLISSRFCLLPHVKTNAFLLGSYLTSRLMLRGIKFEFDVKCLYAFSDAVKTSSLIEIMRWRFILERFIKIGIYKSVIVQLIRQANIIINTLSHLSNDISIEWEKKILKLNEK